MTLNLRMPELTPQEREIQLASEEAAFYRSSLQRIALSSRNSRLGNMARDALKEGRQIRTDSRTAGR